jgi:hypothetical protein
VAAVERLRFAAPVILATFVFGFAVALYYVWVWRSVEGFLLATDHIPRFFEDFRLHFFPMGREFLRLHHPTYGYFYSAFFALLLVPIGQLSYEAAAVAWGIIQVLAFAGVCLLPLWRLTPMSRPGATLYLAVCLSSFPAVHNFRWGQVGMILTLAALAAFHVAMRRRSVLAGTLLAFATCIKYYTGLLVMFFLIGRDIRALVSFVVSAAVFFVLLPSLVLGWEGWIAFQLAAANNLADADWVRQSYASQYFVHIALRWLGFPPLQGESASLAAVLISLVAVAVVALNFGAGELLRRRRHADGVALTASLLFLSFPFLLKTSWPHYFVYLPFCQAAVFCALRRYRTVSPGLAWGLAVLPLLSIGLSSVFVFNLFEDHSAYYGSGCLFLANTLLIPAIYVLSLLPPGEAPGTVQS